MKNLILQNLNQHLSQQANHQKAKSQGDIHREQEVRLRKY